MFGIVQKKRCLFNEGQKKDRDGGNRVLVLFRGSYRWKENKTKNFLHLLFIQDLSKPFKNSICH